MHDTYVSVSSWQVTTANQKTALTICYITPHSNMAAVAVTVSVVTMIMYISA